MKKSNGKIILDKYKRVVPKDPEAALAFYLKELREFNHKDAADFIEKYIANLNKEHAIALSLEQIVF